MSEQDSSRARLRSFHLCDDIRNEVGGKLTLVGLYGTAIRVPSLPITLPKLGIFLEFDFSIVRATVVRLRVITPSGSVMFETPQVNLPPMNPDPLISDEYRQIRFAFQVTPMIINEGGVYTVEVEALDWPVYHVPFLIVVDPSVAAQATPPQSAPTIN